MELAYNFEGYRRLNARKQYEKEVSFSVDSMILPAKVINISTGGALIAAMNLPKIKIGTRILISIPFASKKGSVKRKAIVKWAESDQFGIQFI